MICRENHRYYLFFSAAFLHILHFCLFFRRRSELKTFVTAVITTVAVLDILDVVRILPVLSQDMFELEIFRHVYCSLGVFHELAVAIFIVSISVAVCVQVSNYHQTTAQCSNDFTIYLRPTFSILIVIILAITINLLPISNSCKQNFVSIF